MSGPLQLAIALPLASKDSLGSFLALTITLRGLLHHFLCDYGPREGFHSREELLLAFIRLSGCIFPQMPAPAPHAQVPPRLSCGPGPRASASPGGTGSCLATARRASQGSTISGSFESGDGCGKGSVSARADTVSCGSPKPGSLETEGWCGNPDWLFKSCA